MRSQTRSSLALYAFASVASLLATVFSIQSCSGRTDENTARDYSALTARPPSFRLEEASLCRIELSRFGSTNTFSGVEAFLPTLKEWDIDILWLSPIHPASGLFPQTVRRAVFPTYDYMSVEDTYGTLEDFRSMVRAARARGIRVIVEIAVGYAAWDSKLLQQHADWFTTNKQGAIVSPRPEWEEVAALNFRHHEVKKYMLTMMKFWLADVGVDGFVCLTAEYAPLEFWRLARRELEKHGPLLLIAEGDRPEFHLEVFDASYTANAFFDMRVTREPGYSSLLDSLAAAESSRFPHGTLRLRRIPDSYGRGVDSIVSYTLHGYTTAGTER